MAGGESGVDESQFKGISKYFNSFTDRGRLNTSRATYGALAVLGLYLYLKPKKPADKKAVA